MQCYWPIAEPLVGDAGVNTTKLNQWQRLSWRNVRSNWNDNYTAQFRFDFEGMASNTIAYIDDAMLIDLTAAFGAGNEPTQEWCDTNIEYFAGNTTIQYEAPTIYNLTSAIPNRIKTGDILNCPYSGSVKSITLSKGQYKLECWGAQGGNYSSYQGGYGGYSAGTLTLFKKTIIYLQTGGKGSDSSINGGYNGGGKGVSSGRGGGGASDIRIGQNSLHARVLVAGGGGGSGITSGCSGKGAGGGVSGLEGYQNTVSVTGSNRSGGGASQTEGGISWNSIASTKGSFGQGGSAYQYSCGGGGGGWYGGGGAYDNDSDSDGRNGGGGSGYIYTSTSASTYPSGCLLNSQYYLENATTLAGNTVFTSPTGTSETGHTGNGYIRITVIEAKSGNALIKTTSDAWKEQKQMFVNIGVSTAIPSGLVELEYIKPSNTQYINTQFIPTGNTRVIFTFEPTVTDNQALYTGGRAAASGADAKTFSAFYISKAIRRDYYGTSKTTTTTYDVNTKITVDANKNTTLINNSSALANFTLNTSTTSIMPIILFIAANQTSSTSAIQTSGSGAQYKFYSCKIYDNGTLVRDFIPAKRTSDDKCGLWDKVNFKFYTDENGGNFTAGTEKTTIAAIGTPIEYIQTSGTQYIDSGIYPTNSTRIITKLDFNAISSSTTNYVFGGATGSKNAALELGSVSNKLRFCFAGTENIYDFPSTKPFNIDIDGNSIIINDGIKNTVSSATFTSTHTLYIGDTNRANAAYRPISSIKIYNFKIYNGNTLVRDFIPIKTITNAYGLWDKVNKVFYPNAGTGTFTGGSAVTLSGWHKIKGVWAKSAADTWSQTL